MRTPRIVALGEIMMRLKPPGYERFLQSPQFEAAFGGGEANVAISLAQFGLDAAFVTALPDHAVADACVRFLRGYGVDTSLIVRQGERLGLYFFEAGANQRPSTVIYDRANSSMACARPDDFDWDRIFVGADWFHVTGITAALSQSGADVALRSVQEARKRGLMTCCDFSYRAKLWQYGVQPIDVMRNIITHVDVLIASEEDCRMSLGIGIDQDDLSDAERAEALGAQVFAAYPHLRYQALTRRAGESASSNSWWAYLYDGKTVLASHRYEITQIIDRVGSGDAFAAGLIYGLATNMDRADALNFGAAACCLKHSIPGDVSLASAREVLHLMRGGAAGRVQR